jgi:hypothetical protein
MSYWIDAIDSSIEMVPEVRRRQLRLLGTALRHSLECASQHLVSDTMKENKESGVPFR